MMNDGASTSIYQFIEGIRTLDTMASASTRLETVQKRSQRMQWHRFVNGLDAGVPAAKWFWEKLACLEDVPSS